MDERREARRGENISTDGRSNYTARLSLTNGVKRTTRVSHFKAGLKALRHYHCIPYIFTRNSANHCCVSKPQRSGKKKSRVKKLRNNASQRRDTAAAAPLQVHAQTLYLCNRLARPAILPSFSIFITFPWSSFHLPLPLLLPTTLHPLQSGSTSRAH